MASAGVYEMLWDCVYCGATKLLGKSQKFCPSCGAPQNPDSRYFPAEDDKVEVSGYRYQGADKICPSCSSPNGAPAEFCGQCGASLSGASRPKQLADQVAADHAKFEASLSLRRQQAAQRGQPRPAQPAPAARRTSRLGLWIALGLVALVLGALLWTKEETVTVVGHTWRHEILIERFQPANESAWCGQIPYGAYAVTSHSEVRSYRQLPDGQDCYRRRVDQGDGTFVERQECQPRYRSEPVYDQKCYYQIDRWMPERSIVAKGNDLDPRWPVTGIVGGRACLGCEREGPRSAGYELILRNNDRDSEYRCGMEPGRWHSAREGSRWTLDIGAVDGRPRCGSMRPVP